ncbi:MAG: hypothetical protein KDB03_03300 [Planctomycetales bacterium]|nr:hypothetical protein [Planctomycetales bacterium]
MNQTNLNRWVEIEFDCLPLRSVTSFQVPNDVSPKLAQKFARMKTAVASHGSLNSYYLHNAHCIFRLTNDEQSGMIQFLFEGVVLTNAEDMEARSVELSVTLEKETCSWLNQSIVDWFGETVKHSVLVEFNRYIQAGDLSRTIARLRELEQASDDSGGFVGMYL